jgi:hypothetical protein
MLGRTHLVGGGEVIQWAAAISSCLSTFTQVCCWQKCRNCGGWAVMKWRQSQRASGRAADQIRVGDQPKDRESARPHDPALALATADEAIE